MGCWLFAVAHFEASIIACGLTGTSGGWHGFVGLWDVEVVSLEILIRRLALAQDHRVFKPSRMYFSVLS